jgi:hypothetical protein
MTSVVIAVFASQSAIVTLNVPQTKYVRTECAILDAAVTILAPTMNLASTTNAEIHVRVVELAVNALAVVSLITQLNAVVHQIIMATLRSVARKL